MRPVFSHLLELSVRFFFCLVAGYSPNVSESNYNVVSLKSDGNVCCMRQLFFIVAKQNKKITLSLMNL